MSLLRQLILIDENGNQIGISNNPLYINEQIFSEILRELKINNAYLREIVGEKLTEIDMED